MTPENEKWALATFDALHDASRTTKYWQAGVAETNPFLQDVAQASEARRTALLLCFFPWSARLSGREFFWMNSLGLALQFALHDLNLSSQDIDAILQGLRGAPPTAQMVFPLIPFLKLIQPGHVMPPISDHLRRLHAQNGPSPRGKQMDHSKTIQKEIERILGAAVEKLPEGIGPWSKLVLEIVSSGPARAAWMDLLGHCQAAQTKPTRAWRMRADELIGLIGEERFAADTIRFLQFGPTPGQPPEAQMRFEDSEFLKGLVWCLATSRGPAVGRAVADFGLACLRKIPQVGAVSQRIGFACVNVLGEMEGLEPVAQLARLRAKVRYVVAHNLIERALNTAAARAGIDREQLEDMAVPTCGLDAQGVREEKAEGYMARLALEKCHVSLTWLDSSGKPLRSVPSPIKRQCPDLARELKSALRDIETTLKTQRGRLERLMVLGRPLSFEHWQQNFMTHPLTGQLARGLIWWFETTPTDAVLGAWHDWAFVTVTDKPLALASSMRVRLWHPLGSTAGKAEEWRQWLHANKVVQPCKQAYREVYVPRASEGPSPQRSDRFAGHIIRQHQFSSLCRERGWRYSLMSTNFDRWNIPSLELPDWKMRAEFEVGLVERGWHDEPVSPLARVSGAGISLFLITGGVRFFRESQLLALDEVPAVVFSEVMRDVDLFVSVCSIGNDPVPVESPDPRFATYWQQYEAGVMDEMAKMRHAALRILLPSLKIAGRCRLEGNHLVVRGDLNTYRIHLGTGNARLEQETACLPLAPVKKFRVDLQLPFDDNTLSSILERAMMLAADSKITDPAVLRQIRRISN